MRNVIVMIVVAGLFLAIESLNSGEMIGADPHWMRLIVYMGIGAGIVLTVVGYAAIQFLNWERGRVVGIFLILAVLVMLAAQTGYSGLRAGQDTGLVAAQVWQLGIIAAIATWYASIVGAMSR